MRYKFNVLGIILLCFIGLIVFACVILTGDPDSTEVNRKVTQEAPQELPTKVDSRTFGDWKLANGKISTFSKNKTDSYRGSEHNYKLKLVYNCKDTFSITSSENFFKSHRLGGRYNTKYQYGKIKFDNDEFKDVLWEFEGDSGQELHSKLRSIFTEDDGKDFVDYKYKRDKSKASNKVVLELDFEGTGKKELVEFSLMGFTKALYNCKRE